MEDSIKLMKGAGGVKGERLVQIRIKTVADIKQKNEEELLAISQDILGISIAWLHELKNTAVHPRSCPHTITDHRKSVNPYESKYGERWEEEIKMTAFMKRFVCIRDLVEHIHDQSKEAFAGMVHESDWFF